MKKILIMFCAVGMIGFQSCDIDKTKEGELPEVDVDVQTEAGELPAYDVDWMDINVGTKTKTITVPTVQIAMEEKEVEVPFIDAEWPNEYADEVNEQTIYVEADVTGTDYELDIEEVYAKGSKLIVISELEPGDKEIGEKTMRVSDQIVINAPDLSVKHYIIGEKPNKSFNNAYTYVSNRNELNSRLEGAKKIFG